MLVSKEVAFMSDENKIKDEELKDASGGIFNLNLTNGVNTYYQTNEMMFPGNTQRNTNITNGKYKSNADLLTFTNDGILCYSNDTNTLKGCEARSVVNQDVVNVNGLSTNGFTLHDSNNNNPNNKWVK